jgi:hypothetical protein
MKFDQVYGETLDMYELADFLGADIYSSFFKKHGRFYDFFHIDGYVSLCYLELYFRYRNLGALMGPTHKIDSELTPLKCCRSGSEKKCYSISLRNRLFEMIDTASQEGGQISEINLWHKIFTSDISCYLKDWPQFQFALFELVELRQIEITSRSNNQKSFRRYNEVKRGPGRPKKY